MRSFMILLLICGSCVAQQSIDEFTQQQQPEKDNAVAKVKLTGTKVADVEYAMVGDHKLLLDLYLPKQPMGSPLVVWIHGGGWYQNNKSKIFVSSYLIMGLRSPASITGWWM